jgi:hypothetical protein
MSRESYDPVWRDELRRLITVEHDPEKMILLCKELDEIMLAEERLKVRRRFQNRISASPNPRS